MQYFRIKAGYKPLSAFFRSNIDRTRKICLRLGAVYITLALREKICMNLEDYIAETIRQIVAGVSKAQSLTLEHSAVVNPKMHSNPTINASLGIIPLGTGAYAQLVHFDVALTVKKGTGTKGGIGVASGIVNLGSAGQSSNEDTAVNHVKFSIPLALPPSPKC